MATITDKATILDHMAALADPARCRLLLLLEKRELTVSDLCAVMQLPQSTVSRQLKTLGDHSWVVSRRDGTSRLYRCTAGELNAGAQRLWEVTREELSDSPAVQADQRRLESVLARRRSRSLEFFDASGPRWDATRDELFGDKFHLSALLGLAPADTVVADLGCGTGMVAEALAPFVRRVIGIDASSPMLEVAHTRLERFPNVELRPGELADLPLDDGQVDVATLMLVLHHMEHPEAAVREASRCLRKGGTILIVDMLPHERDEYQQEMGHMWMGFSQELIESFLDEAGFGSARFVVLPPAPEAKGPNLFAASATKKGD